MTLKRTPYYTHDHFHKATECSNAVEQEKEVEACVGLPLTKQGEANSARCCCSLNYTGILECSCFALCAQQVHGTVSGETCILVFHSVPMRCNCCTDPHGRVDIPTCSLLLGGQNTLQTRNRAKARRRLSSIGNFCIVLAARATPGWWDIPYSLIKNA